MAKVTWLLVALDDVAEICEFIAKDSPRAAHLFARRVFASTDRLPRFPRSARIVPEVGREDVREILVGDYRVIYRLLPHENEVMTVIHGSRIFRPKDLQLEPLDD